MTPQALSVKKYQMAWEFGMYIVTFEKKKSYVKNSATEIAIWCWWRQFWRPD
jgi:hypothetical protein